jgi:protease IV
MSFFKSFLASLLAIVVSFFIVFFFFVALIAGLASSGGEQAAPTVRVNSVLEIPISGLIPEVSVDDPFEQIFNPGAGAGKSMMGIIQNLEKAAADDKIKGVLLNVGLVSTSWSNLYEIREAIVRFKESGKFVYATTDDMGMNELGYYVATASDSLFTPPVSLFEFDGFYVQPYFLKEMFDKLGIEAQVGRSGSFKSAAEQFTRTNLSAENRLQYQEILSSTTDEFIRAVVEFTGKSREEIDQILNNSPVLYTTDAFEKGLIHELLYPEEVTNRIKTRLNVGDGDRLNTISSNRYYRVPKSAAGLEETKATDKIALIRASGNIMPDAAVGFGEEVGMITVKNFKSSLDKVLKDKNVKALVVRIDSPGGAATTSDMLYKMIREASEKMPVVASMSNVAASGGYYMAMGADTVMASPFTITGSIGVISIKYNVAELMNKKIGITFDEIRSHRNADWLSLTKPFNKEQADLFQDFNNRTYEVFLQVVSENRGMTRDQVHELAQGRVWTGKAALDNGLVDIQGGYDDAFRVAAEMAGITDYKRVMYPVEKTFIERLTQSTQSMTMSLFRSENELQQLARKLMYLAGPGQGFPLARMPFDLRIL